MTPAFRRMALIVIPVLLLTAQTCGSNGRGGKGSSLSLMDSLGRRVDVPLPAERIISLEPEITRILVALGEEKRLVGIDFFLRYHDHLFPLVCPEGADLPVISNQGQDLNFETAMRLSPELIFTSPSEFGMTEAVERKMGIPAAALASAGKLGSLLNEIAILGEIVGRTDRAEELISYFNNRVGAVRLAVSDVEGTTSPRAYLSFWGTLLRTPVSYEPVDAAGGVNVASGLLPSYLGAAGATVQMEKILLWNPDVILIQGNYPPGERVVTVEGVLSDPRLQTVRAVRDGRVHYTFGFWYWWDPALVLIETLYLSHLFHPGLDPAFDLEREGNAIFEKFYGVGGVFTELSAVLKCDEWNVF